MTRLHCGAAARPSKAISASVGSAGSTASSSAPRELPSIARQPARDGARARHQLPDRPLPRGGARSGPRLRPAGRREPDDDDRPVTRVPATRDAILERLARHEISAEAAASRDPRPREGPTMTAARLDTQTTEHPIGPRWPGRHPTSFDGDVRLQGDDGDRVIVRVDVAVGRFATGTTPAMAALSIGTEHRRRRSRSGPARRGVDRRRGRQRGPLGARPGRRSALPDRVGRRDHRAASAERSLSRRCPAMWRSRRWASSTLIAHGVGRRRARGGDAALAWRRHDLGRDRGRQAGSAGRSVRDRDRQRRYACSRPSTTSGSRWRRSAATSAVAWRPTAMTPPVVASSSSAGAAPPSASARRPAMLASTVSRAASRAAVG